MLSVGDSEIMTSIVDSPDELTSLHVYSFKAVFKLSLSGPYRLYLKSKVSGLLYKEFMSRSVQDLINFNAFICPFLILLIFLLENICNRATVSGLVLMLV